MNKIQALYKIETFNEYLLRTRAFFENGENVVKCIKCSGDGKIYDPDDPRDPYEGNKFRRTIICTACDGMKVGLLSSWKVQYTKIVLFYKEQNIQIKNDNALIKSASKKLTKQEKQVLGI